MEQKEAKKNCLIDFNFDKWSHEPWLCLFIIERAVVGM